MGHPFVADHALLVGFGDAAVAYAESEESHDASQEHELDGGGLGRYGD